MDNQNVGTLISIVGGGLITIFTAIFVEWLRKPNLELVIEHPPFESDFGNEKHRHLRLKLRNKPLHPALRWMQRSAALQCRGEIRFHDGQGHDLFGNRAMPVRWSASPAPVSISGQIVGLDDPPKPQSRIVVFSPIDSTIDVYPGEEQTLDVAVRFKGEEECYGWNNEAYFYNWRTPAWKIPRGSYQVEVIINSSGNKCVGWFNMFNQVDDLSGFYLALPEPPPHY